MTDTTYTDAVPPTRAATIGVPQLTAYYVSNLIGAGIFVLPALAQQAAGPWTLLAWGLMVLCSVPTAWVMGRIAIDYANDNGVLDFVRQIVSPRLAAALSRLIVLIMVVGNPVMGLISARYALVAFGLNEALLFPLATGFMLLSIAFNMLGLRNSARIQTLLVTTSMLVLVALAMFSLGAADTLRPEPAPLHVSGLFAAIGICFFAFLGWENVATIAPDVKRPARTFPLALAISVPLIGGVYLLVALALLLVTQDKGGLGGNFAVMDHLVAPFGDPRVSLAVNGLTLTVVVLSTNAWVLSASRLLSAAVRDGHLPNMLANRDGSRMGRTCLTLAVAYSAVLALMHGFGQSEKVIVPLISAGFLVIYAWVLWGAARRYAGSPIGYLAIAGLTMVLFFVLSVWLQSLIVLSITAIFYLREASARSHTAPTEDSHVRIAARNRP